MPGGVPRRHAVAAIVVVVVVALVGGVAAPVQGSNATSDQAAESVKLVRVSQNSSAQLWPYTSRQREFDTLTLPINVVVRTDAATARRILAGSEGTNASWRATTPDNETVLLNGTAAPWGETDGATRYTYVDTESGGYWADETYQLHDGNYFGTRDHLRLYEGGDDEETWTAIQAHAEHWDWFRLRHTVSSVAEGREKVEHEFYGTRYLASVDRERYANGGIMDADGWVTVVDVVRWTTGGPRLFLLPAGLVAALGVIGGRVSGVLGGVRAAAGDVDLTRHHVALALVLAVVPLAVRLAGIALETATPLGAKPKAIAALLYPVLALGLPLAAVAGGRDLPAEDGFAVAVLGLAAGFLLDYAFIGVSVLPVKVVLNRAFLLVAVGLLAAGGTRWADDWAQRHRYRVVGAALWLVGLAWPLFELGALFGLPG